MTERNDGWMLPQAAFDMIEERIPKGGSIIEFGSGEGSIRLMGKFQLTSIEHDEKWAKAYPGSCIFAPISENKRSSLVGETGWYDENQVRSAFSEVPIDLLLIDGPTGDIGRTGILEYPDLLLNAKSILVDDVHRAGEHSLALSIANLVNGSLAIHQSDQLQFDGINRSWAWIDLAKPTFRPKKLSIKSPNIPIIPKKMVLDLPRGLANDYQHIQSIVEKNRYSWSPELHISIVITLYNRKEMLDITLAALTNQTYPLKLLEVIIADDGSSDLPEDIIKKYEETLDIKFITHADRGYRAAATRNMGMRAASYSHIILLDCDVAPVPNLVEEYSRYFGISDQILLCGHRRYVDATKLSGDQVKENINSLLSLPDIETSNMIVKGEQIGPTLDWRIPIYQKTDNLLWEKYPFRACCSGNLGFHRKLLDRAGWFDEDFTAWGAEDTEWGFRIWNSGHWIIPVWTACGLHQEPVEGRNETDREAGRAITHQMLIDKVPLLYRTIESREIEHSVPLVSIYMPAFNAEDTIIEAVESALNQTWTDIEICIVNDGSSDNTRMVLENKYGSNRKVRWINQENSGISSASNRAIKMCRGVYIGQLDSDDILQPNAVETLLNQIRKDSRIGVVYGSYQKINENGIYIEDGYNWPEYSREKLLSGMIIHHFRLFRARDWWRTDGFSEDLENGVDYDMFLKLSEVTEFEHVDEWTYLYRIHAKSTSISKKKLQDINTLKVINRALSRRRLDKYWTAIIEDESAPRKITFQQISSQLTPLDEKTKTHDEKLFRQNNEESSDEGLTDPAYPEIFRLKIGPFNQFDLFLRAKRRLKMFRWFWSFHTMAENPGLKPSLSLVSGRLDEERAEKELKRFQKKFKSWKIEIVRTER